MYEHFGDSLSRIMEDYSESKNSLIQRTGIDRSSFFQILKGKRIPTEEQFSLILNALMLPETDTAVLKEAWLYDRLGDKCYKSRRIVLSLLKLLSESDDQQFYDSGYPVNLTAAADSFTGTIAFHSVSELKSFIYAALLHSRDYQENQIDLFLSLKALYTLDFYSMERALSAGSSNEQDPSSSDSNAPQFRHILSFFMRTPSDPEELFHDYQEYIRFLISYSGDFRSYYYYNPSTMEDHLGSLYPYYMILPFGVLLINTGCDGGLFLSDASFLTEYRQGFEHQLTRMKPLITNVDTIEDYIPTLLRLPDETKTWYLSWQPGISYIATDELIRTYLPAELQELYMTHVHAFQHMDYHEYVTPEGFQAFLGSKRLQELQMDLTARKEDLPMLMQMLQSRLGQTLDIVRPDVFPISKNWAIHIVSGRTVSFVPIFQGSRAIFIHERWLAECFEDFLTNLDDNALLSPEHIQEMFCM